MRESGKGIHSAEATHPSLEVLGPLPAPMPRRAGYQRQQLILSSPSRKALHAALEAPSRVNMDLGMVLVRES